MANMQAIRVHNYGGPEVLQYEDAPCPEPESGELLIKVHAASVNAADWKVRAGYMKEFIPVKLPFVPGFDFSGVVEDGGAGINQFKKGIEVFGRANIFRGGAYAQYAIAREAETAPKPKTVDHVHAGAIPVAASTAWQALFDKAQLAAGQKILIHGAAGGVGSFAVQFAKWKGAQVIATASGKNQDFLRGLGVDEAMDYQKTRFEDVVRDVDVVFDAVGGDTQQRSWRVLKRGGILVSIVAPPAQDEAAKYGVRGEMFGSQGNAAQLAEIGRLVAEGRVKVVVDTVLPLAEARRAHELGEHGHPRGKIVLQV